MCSRFVIALTILLASAASGQQRVDPRFTYHRVLCILPLTGSGSEADPVRPDTGAVSLAPPASGTHEGVLGFHQEVSDDGRWALLEIVAYDRTTLLPILEDKRPGVWAVEKGSIPREEVETAFRRLKRNIDLDLFGVVIR